MHGESRYEKQNRTPHVLVAASWKSSITTSRTTFLVFPFGEDSVRACDKVVTINLKKLNFM